MVTYFSQSQIFDQLLFPIRAPFYSFDSGDKVQFVRLLWITPIFFMITRLWLKYLKEIQQGQVLLYCHYQPLQMNTKCQFGKVCFPSEQLPPTAYHNLIQLRKCTSLIFHSCFPKNRMDKINDFLKNQIHDLNVKSNFYLNCNLNQIHHAYNSSNPFC